MFYIFILFLISFSAFGSNSDLPEERKPTWLFKAERQIPGDTETPQQFIVYGTVHNYPIETIPTKAMEMIMTCDVLYGEKIEEESNIDIISILTEQEMISTKYQSFYSALSEEAQRAIASLNAMTVEEKKGLEDLTTIDPRFFWFYNIKKGLEDLTTIHPGFISLYNTFTDPRRKTGMDSVLRQKFKTAGKTTGGFENAREKLFIQIEKVKSEKFLKLDYLSRTTIEKILISMAKIESGEENEEQRIISILESESNFNDILEKHKTDYERVDISSTFKSVCTQTYLRNTKWIDPTLAMLEKHPNICVIVGCAHLRDSAENPEAKSYLRLLHEQGFSISQMYTDGSFESYSFAS